MPKEAPVPEAMMPEADSLSIVISVYCFWARIHSN